jgi:RHS repeat-associated protein
VLYLTDAPDVIYRRVFEPYGGVAAESVGTALHEHIFTGKREDADTRVGSESGLIHFGARWYDAEIGRFLSIDPIVQTLDDPQTHNPYGYVRNNPLNHVDPDGREWFRILSGFGTLLMVAGVVTGQPYLVSIGATMLNVGQAAAGNTNAALVFGGIAAIAGAYPGMTGAGAGGKMPLLATLGATAEGAASITPGMLDMLALASANIIAASGDLDSAADAQPAAADGSDGRQQGEQAATQNDRSGGLPEAGANDIIDFAEVWLLVTGAWSLIKLGYGLARASIGRAVAGSAEDIAKTVDTNKLHHIFGQARHKLDPLVTEFGSPEKAFAALQRSTQAAVDAAGTAEGALFKHVVKVGSMEVSVSGRVVDGVARIGTARVP